MRAQIGILYEHPEWFAPLFAELDKLDVDYDHLLAHLHTFDPVDTQSKYAIVVNRMSPSAYTREHGNAIFYVAEYLSYLEGIGVDLVNGKAAYDVEISKAKQLALLKQLGLKFPKARVINHPGQAPAAAEGLEYPVIVKPNIGGSGAKIQKFDDADSLRAAAADEGIDLGIDKTSLVQEYLPLRDGHIVRVEVLDGKYLYAIKIYPDPDKGFNLCPADVCQIDSSADDDNEQKVISGYLSEQKEKTQLQIEAFEPSTLIKNAVLDIARQAHLDLGGIEYLVNDRDGEVYYYDINVLSNFVTDAEKIIGFNPYTTLAEYIKRRAELSQAA